MALFAYLAGSDKANSVRLNAFGLTSRADGSGGIGGIIFDDPTSALTVRGWMRVIVKETACTSAPVLFTGYVLDRNYSRSDGETTYRVGSGRFIDTNLADENACLHVRLITNPDGKRPAETHNQRIDWLLASSYVPSGIDDSLVDTSHPRPMDEADYRGQYADDVLNDIAAPIFKTWFMYPVEPAGGRGLFFANAQTTYSQSPLTISNVLSDITFAADGSVSGTCFPPSVDAVLNRDPSEVYSIVRYHYAKGVVLEGDSTTQTTFFADNDLGNRGLNVDNSRIGSEASARIAADSILDRDSEENDTITVTIQLPAASVGLVQAGQRIGVRFSHIDDYTSLTYTRISAVTVQQTPGTNVQYDVTLELNAHGLSGGGGGGAPLPGDFPHPTSSSLSIIQQSVGLSNRTMPAAIGDDDVLVIVSSKRASAIGGVGTWLTYTDSGEGDVHGTADYVKGVYKTASGESQVMTGSSLDEADGWYEITAGATLTDHKSATGSGYIASTASISVPAGGIAFAAAGIGNGGGFDAGGPAPTGYDSRWTPDTGWTEDLDQRVFDGHPASWIGYYKNSTTAAVSITPSLSFINDGQGPWPWQMVVMVFGPSSSSSQPPDPTQDVLYEAVTPSPDGLITTFTTAHPFADGSLHVYVDHIDETAAVTSYDGACGDFTLAFAPRSWETVLVSYQGR